MNLYTLLFLVGCVAANGNWGWTPNKEYEFEYHGRLITGLPELASQYSGLGMRARVKVFAKTADTLVLKVEDPTYVHINNVLYPKERGADVSYGVDGWNWRNLYLPNLSPVPAEHQTILAKPCEFVLAYNGAVREVSVSRDEPEWSINFKKALVVLFQAKVDSLSWEIQDNRIARPLAEGRTTWKVKEDSLYGRCENIYQVNELPEYILTETPEILPTPELCPSASKYFEITRTRNLDSCERRSSFSFMVPAHSTCDRNTNSNCGTTVNRMSVTRFIVCAAVESSTSTGSNGIARALHTKKMVIQKVINEMEQNIDLVGYNTERFVTGNRQVMKLKAIRAANAVPDVANPIKLYDLMYEYDLGSGSSTGGGSNGGNKGRMESESNSGANGLTGEEFSKALPKTMLGGMGSGGDSLPISQIKEQIKQLLIAVGKEIINADKASTSEESNRSNVNLKLMSVVRGFSMLKKVEDFEELFNEICSAPSDPMLKEPLSNYFIDTAAMAGTPASVEFIVKMAEQDKMTKVQMGHYFTWMPHHIVFPTRHVLEKLFNFIRSEKIRPNSMLFNVAVTSFTKLVHQACLSEERFTTYPTFVTGEFCHPESRIVQQKWIPFLLGELASSQDPSARNLFFVALGMLHDRTIITELIPYVDGTIARQGGKHISELNRLMATYSLANVGVRHPHLAIPVIMTVFSNPAESTEMRVAAFNCILRLNPSEVVFQRVAAITRQETGIDLELLKTINTALFTLGNQVPSERFRMADAALISKAKMAFRMVRRSHGIIPTSGTIYTTDFMHQLGLGYESFVAYIASESSILPKGMYTELNYDMQDFHLTAFRFGYRFKGSENLYGKMGDILMKGLKGMSGGNGGAESESMEWGKVMSKLGLEAKSGEGKMSAAVLLEAMESAPLFFSSEKLTTEWVGEQLMPYLRNPHLLKQKLGDEMRVNLQHTMDLSHMDMLIPSDMGLPITMEFHTPLTYSISGEIKPTFDGLAPKVDIDGKVVLTGQYIAFIGTFSPFTQEALVTGVNQHSVINIPGKLQLSVDLPAQKVGVMVKPSERIAQPMAMLHFHMYPFTLAQKIFDLKAIPEQAELKPIRSASEPKKVESQFGDYLGVKMISKFETESRFADMASFFEILRMYKNPWNMLAFAWTSPALSEKLRPSVRSHKFTLIFDPTQSSTKALGFEVKVGCATKKAEESAKMYHSLKKSSGSGTSSGSGSGSGPWSEVMKTISPVEISEKTLGSSPVHRGREGKLNELMGTLEQPESAVGVTLAVTGIIQGASPRAVRAWTSIISILSAQQRNGYGKLQQKWDVRLERPAGSADSPKHLCVSGKLVLPILPIWNVQELLGKNIEFVFENEIGMGMSSCTESKITTHGNAICSESQKEFAKTSHESKMCQKLKSEHSPGAESSIFCKTAALQAATLDTIQIRNQFTSVPAFVKKAEQNLTFLIKAYLWPFMRDVQGKSVMVAENTFTTSMRIEFQKWARAFNLLIKRPNESVTFKTIHISYPLNLFVPIKAGRDNFVLAASKITPFGGEMKCSIEPGSIRKFNGKAIPFNPTNGCEYLVAMDARPEKKEFVIKVIGEGAKKTAVIDIRNKKIAVKWTSSPILEVDGGNVALPAQGQSPLEIKDPKGRKAATVERFSDRVVLKLFLLDAPMNYIRVVTNGDIIEISSSAALRNKITGLCGSSNLNIKYGSGSGSGSMGGNNGGASNKCVYSKAALEVAAYQISSGSCPSLEPSIKTELEKEKGRCARKTVSPTMVFKGYIASSGKPTRQMHVSVERPGELCISKVPITTCGPLGRPAGEKVKMDVPFVCIPAKTRLAEHIAHKINSGHMIGSELGSLSEAFKSSMEQPRNCVSAASGSGVEGILSASGYGSNGRRSGSGSNW